ncbi:hypothetical protein DPMN_057316 [Dreissena polymorpha]|uniref:Uncharacterized protein n=1 Tax=Dreissena polymorpha TaxID=45954 RepID=A0A9D4BZX2_DREPO|nr:hypothetical protein DPMN_057316 [Dreissena polymorpha]
MRQRPEGVNLGLKDAVIMWQGYGGLSLLDVVGILKTLKKVAEIPDLIKLHCGGNDFTVPIPRYFFGSVLGELRDPVNIFKDLF